MPTMQEVKFKRKTTSEIDNLAIEDGSLIYNVENGKTYMDYGNERIPTGGGANGGIYVGDTEPTDEDITLWVDTNTSETKASEIVNTYTQSDTVGYSTNYVNNAIKEVYSTQEREIGVYIDSNNVEHKLYQITLSGSAATNTAIRTNWNYHIIDIGGIVEYYDGSYVFGYPNSSNNMGVYGSLTSGNLRIYHTFSGQATYRITIKYIKN